jgi:hypothetical protein
MQGLYIQNIISYIVQTRLNSNLTWYQIYLFIDIPKYESIKKGMFKYEK